MFVGRVLNQRGAQPTLRQGTQGREGIREGAQEPGKNITLISSITVEGMGLSMSPRCSSETDSFSLYIREILAPTLKRGQIVLMDNLSVHTSKWVRELIEE